ncbi:hypothetical protein KZX32_06920 [Corynebacterium kefirresidentii]|uniref:hypothetical protein n=1 Tax=Corynebacterium kefirresidentii TaxID=1979527 RepID=UPI002006C74C|nr:hypothetical protein [Corynebacterium kefirresidentii]MCK6083219.1 hypothetical protein [Corynebacterium kefirresidentii]
MTKYLPTPTLPELVGQNLHRLRYRFSLTEFVGVAREYGATWSTSSISAIERGNANVTLEGLGLIQVTLSELLNRPVQLNELLGFDPSYNPNEHWDEWDEETQTGINHNEEDYWGADKLVQWTNNQFIYVSDVVAWINNPTPDILQAGFERAKELLRLAGKLPPVVTPGEERLAAKLGISAEQLQDWAQQLWGEAIEARRDRLAGEGASPQKRGRVSGKLLDELRQAQEEGRLGNGQ